MKNLSMCHKCIMNSEEVKVNYFFAPVIIKKRAVTCKKKTKNKISRDAISKLTNHLNCLIAS